jgi:hypothetical protein
MLIYLDLRVLGTTSWTVHLLTGSQEVRGFESLRLHQVSGTFGPATPRLWLPSWLPSLAIDPAACKPAQWLPSGADQTQQDQDLGTVAGPCKRLV